MATFDYSKSINTANKLLNKFGNEVIIELPDTSTFVETGVLLNIQQKDRPDTLTDNEVYKVIMTANNNTPQVGDYIEIGGVKWAIRLVDPLKVDGVTTVINTCFVSK